MSRIKQKADKYVRQRNCGSPALLMGMLNGEATYENGLAVPHEVKELPNDPEIPFLGKYIHTKTYICSLIPNGLRVKTTQMPMD
jgi:hypothetical protein